MKEKGDIIFEFVSGENVSASVSEEILLLCSAAFEEDFRSYLELLENPVHLLARQSNVLVSHVAWVTRWLQVDEDKMLRTAYIEAVATAPECQRRGFGSAVMRHLVMHLDNFDIAALSPSDEAFYKRLGWEMWRGQLAVRTKQGLMPSPDEKVMIYRLSRTPKLDLDNLLTIEWRPGEEVW